MRATPTVVIYGFSGASGRCSSPFTGVDIAGTAVANTPNVPMRTTATFSTSITAIAAGAPSNNLNLRLTDSQTGTDLTVTTYTSMTWVGNTQKGVLFVTIVTWSAGTNGDVLEWSCSTTAQFIWSAEL